MQNFKVKDILEATGGRLLCGSPETPIETMSTDSDSIGGRCLFVPIIGERVDAHRFIDGAVANGAKAVLTSEHDALDMSVPCIRVENTVTAMQEIGRAYGNRMNIPKIGITGSVGKTTTKEMVACALSAGFRVFKTEGNSNSQIGVPQTLSRISADDEIAVIEMGMSMPGEMKRLAELLTLDSAVVTNIGVSHIEALKTRDGICEEKFRIEDALVQDGCVFLNGDDEILLKHMGSLRHDAVLFGLGENNDYRAVNIKSDGTRSEFDAVIASSITYHTVLKVPGTHNVRNALAALAAADRYSVPLEDAVRALADYGGVDMRQQISEVCGVTVIDDSYNASPDSMKAGIEVLAAIKAAGRRVAVLADMLELGEASPRYHYEVGEFISGQKIDELVLFGELAANIADGAKVNSQINIVFCDSREEINDYLQRSIRFGDAVLFKASRGMKLNECAEYFKERYGNGKNN
ncbi:MAG: UDP-N-acetylmuramoyl-tripeptide--D-alanyl-D-alanine ligase [Butyrivibrio sp.]|nr:UDP-N-acetylmuramoyl-tripeptide--D-alanyl-D-alanine ligase [Butyrivibrio sp.]